MRGSASELGSARMVAATSNARLLMVVPGVLAVLLAVPYGTFARPNRVLGHQIVSTLRWP